MSKCPSCSSELREPSPFCPSCGGAITPLSQMPTELSPSGQDAQRYPPPSSGVGRLASSDSVELGGFTPGTMLAGRYRVVGLLGRGGMGEVYRADDLKLGQPVALKFLPRKLAEDPARLERFYSEVRNARQVSHPNVCRVYDIGELDGQHYLSMEYVDGEDLASLLKRIGRLPQDKALEIARQLCVGLAAAHERGVLHRDLKPANVMIDGRGHARITDFGLAVRAEEGLAETEVAGTPAYLSPEQLAGKGASVRSDLYALGLVFYELYTGKQAFKASTLAEMIRKQKEEMPPSPSSIVRDIDPAVERVILRCLDKDPRQRPASALQVATALPGGDPLQAALAAGETPSPEMVAAAGEKGTLAPAVAWACLASFLLGLFLIALLAQETTLYGKTPLEKPPEALADRAREVIKKLGYTLRPADSAYGLWENGDYLRYVEENDRSVKRWERLATGQPPAIIFWYRQSPRLLVPQNREGGLQYEDPPTNISGMANVWLDMESRLGGFRAVPPQYDASKGPWRDPDWSQPFAEAGLDLAKFTPAEPVWMPPVGFDRRWAWEGVYPRQPDIRLRVEAASFHGKPVYFNLFDPWDRPARMQVFKRSVRVEDAMWSALSLVCLVGSVLLARRNLRLGRGDRKGAFRIAVFYSSFLTLSWLFSAHHVPAFGGEWGLLTTLSARVLVALLGVWLLYIALEPFVRRRWPNTLISWNRLLAGRLRDPLIGRDILIGGLAGVVILLFMRLRFAVPAWLGMLPPAPERDLGGIGPARRFVASFLEAPTGVIGFSLGTMFLLVLLRFLLRKQWLAMVAWVLILTVMFGVSGENPLVKISLIAVAVTLLLFTLMRFGLLCYSVAILVPTVFEDSPLTLDFSAWYAGRSLLALLLFAGLAVYGFHTALAGRPLFGRVLED